MQLRYINNCYHQEKEKKAMKRKGNDDELYLANVLHFDNCTVYLYRPILTPEERERRYENIRRALRRIGPSLIAAEERRKKKEMEEREQAEPRCD